MTSWEILPYEGIGKLRFGTDRTKVRQLLGEKFKSFKRGGEPTDTDFYESLGLFLSYDNDDKLEFMEIVAPCKPTFDGINLLEIGIDELLQNFVRLGYTPMNDEAGFNLEELGIMLYVPSTQLEAVSLYRKGYYDELL